MMDLKQIVQLQMAEIDKLRAENQRLVAWIMGDAPDALTYLQRVYSDPNVSEARRDKTALGALPFEKAKPAATVNNVFSLANYLDQQAQLRKDALERQRELEARTIIEHQPRKPLDFNEPTPPTILGEGQGHHGAYRDHEPDPAA